MVTGKRFQLTTSTLALDTIEGKRVAVSVPAETVVKVVSGPSEGSELVDVLWEGRMVLMFGIDLDVRGIEITEHAATA
jgi:hypothetical protein